jgi:L-amino acid N-acyltransferase YncA
MDIRLATASDLPAICEIYNGAVATKRDTTDTAPLSEEAFAPILESFDPATRPIWVAEMDGDVHAYLQLRDFYGRPGYEHTAELGFYVHTDWKRRGIATRLVEHALTEASSLNLRTLLAYVFAHNIESLTLLRVFGFEQWGLLKEIADLGDQHGDLVILGRVIQPDL